MDPISIATGIVSLYSTCNACFNFFSDVKNADGSARAQRLEFEIQADMLRSWGFCWELDGSTGSHLQPGTSSDMRPALSQKLVKFVGGNHFKLRAIENALDAIADSLSDEDGLLKRYGVKLTAGNDDRILGKQSLNMCRSPSPSSRRAAKFRSRMGMFDRARWTLKDGEKFKSLTQILRARNDDLRHLCPDGAYEAMAINFATQSLGRVNDRGDLKQLAAAVAEHLQHPGPQLDESSSKDGFLLLEDLAQLKTRANEDRMVGLTEQQKEELLNMSEQDFKLSAADDSSTLALWIPKDQIVFIEFKSYVDDAGYKNRTIRDDVLKLGRLLCDARTPSRFNSMPCLGLFKNTVVGHIGFVYKLPSYLGQWHRNMSANDWDLRRPHRLSTSLKYVSMVPLGWRFDLAQDLMKSIVLLHTSGWLHKNIRPASIVFFPDNRSPMSRAVMDWSKARVMGWGYTRSHTDDESENALHSYLPTDMSTKNAIELDLYHHPDKRAHPDWRYQHAYDLYSLGLVLLEIGLWKPLDQLVSPTDDQYKARKYLIEKQQPLLVASCGEIYAGVVGELLGMETQTSKVGLQEQRERMLRLYADLNKCCA